MGLFSRKQNEEIITNNSQMINPVNEVNGFNQINNQSFDINNQSRFAVRQWEVPEDNSFNQNLNFKNNYQNQFNQQQFANQQLPINNFNNQQLSVNNFDSQQSQYFNNNQPYYNQPNSFDQNQYNNPYQNNNMNFNNNLQNQYNQPLFNPYNNQYNPYNNQLPQQFQASKFEDEIIDDPMVVQQKLRAKRDYGEKFVTKGVLPKELRFEINHEKIRVITMIGLGLVGLIYVLINVILQKTSLKLNLNPSYKPSTFIMVSISLLAIFLIVFGASDLMLLNNNVKKCKNEAINYGKIFVPHFIKRNYKKILTRYIYVNWLCFSAYLVTGITIGILEFLNNKNHFLGSDQSFSAKVIGITIILDNFKYIPRQTDIVISVIILISTLCFHIYTILDSRIRKNNIISLYETEIISSEEVAALKKRANKICLITFIVFVVLLLFVFAIILFLVKKCGSSSNKNVEGSGLKRFRFWPGAKGK